MAGLVKLFLRGLSKSQLPGAERNSGEPPQRESPSYKGSVHPFPLCLGGVGCCMK